jgi:hypothetical protein
MEVKYNSLDVLGDNSRAQDEFTLQLVDALTPPILQGFRDILDSSIELCREQGEEEKYLMTFQNTLARIPGWNASVIAAEVERITQATQIGYLPDLVTGVHIIHLRILSSVRVGHKPKRIEIDPPDFDKFVHRVYCVAGRKMWTYTYLFRCDVTALDQQRNMHECEKIIRDCVVAAVRESMPMETVLRAYIDEAEDVSIGTPAPTLSTSAPNDAEKGKASKSVDVESEVKLINKFGGGGNNDNDSYDDDDNATNNITSNPSPLSVGFAPKNEVLNMGTNKTAEVPMAPVRGASAILPGPPLQEVTVLDLVSSNSGMPRSLNLARPPLSPNGLEEVTLGIVPTGTRPTLSLDTGEWD